jgi:deoxyribose-phosphate aldolase
MSTTSIPDRWSVPSRLARHVDHTLLRPTAVPADFERLCDEAVRYGFWSVCVPSGCVKLVAGKLRGSGVRICTVVGFPLGYSSSPAKRAEAGLAVQDGTDEIDMVMNVGAFKGGEYDLVSGEIRDIASDCKRNGKLLKVILECCYLTDEEKVIAARLAESMGADYVKTSTGFGTGGATVEDVSLLHESLAGTAKVKASGGIDSLDKALAMLNAGADRLGTSSGRRIMEELAHLNNSR